MVATKSGTHRDQPHSILYSVWGAKTVYIAPPNIHVLTSDTHTQHSPDHQSWLRYDPFEEEDRRQPNEGGWARVDLIPVGSLFLPKGWWHNVFSPANTIGVSIDIVSDSADGRPDARNLHLLATPSDDSRAWHTAAGSGLQLPKID